MSVKLRSPRQSEATSTAIELLELLACICVLMICTHYFVAYGFKCHFAGYIFIPDAINIGMNDVACVVFLYLSRQIIYTRKMLVQAL